MLSVILTSILVAIPALYYGGWPWAAILSSAIAIATRQLKTPLSILALTSISLLWLIPFQITGDRRLYFPFTIQLAVQLFALSPRPILASTLLVAIFAAIRLFQSATLIVLLVELLVSAAAIAIPAWYFLSGPPVLSRRLIAAALGSLLAFAGLIF